MNVSARQYSWEHANGAVLSCSPSAGSNVTYGGTITITVGKGAKPITAGDYVYVDPGTRYYGTTNGGGGTGVFTNGKYGTVKYTAGGIYPYNINGTGWVPASAVHQRTN